MYEVASEPSLGSWLPGWVGRWEHRKFGTTPVPTRHLTQRPCSHSYRLVPIPVRPKSSDTRSQERHDYLLSIFYGNSELSTRVRGCGLQVLPGRRGRRWQRIDGTERARPPVHRKQQPPSEPGSPALSFRGSYLGLHSFTSSVFLTS